MSFPSETYVNQIQDPAVRAEFQQLYSLFQGYLSAQHKDSGAHSAITADSLTATGAISSNGNVTSSAASTPVVIGNQFDVLPSASNARGLLIGPSTDGLVLARRTKGTHFGGGGTYSLALFDLAQSSTIPALEFALDTGVPTLVDGGTGSTAPSLGNVLRPFASVYAAKVYRANYTAAQGEWTSVSFNSANFTASAGNWTVDAADQVTLAYTLVGTTMVLSFEIANTDVSAAPLELRIAIPGGFTAAYGTRSTFQANDAGTKMIGVSAVVAAGTFVSLFKDAAGTAWTLTAGDNTTVRGQIVIPV